MEVNNLKRYIISIFNVIYSFTRFILIKIFNYRAKFTFSILNLVSPFTNIELGKGSFLKLEKKIRLKSGVKIRIRDYAILSIGENTFINHNCIITAHKRIKIGSNVQIGPNVLIYDHDHDFRAKNGLKRLKYRTSDVEIGNNVWIGANVVILRGTKIGDNSVVGAGTIIKGNHNKNSLIYTKNNLVVKKITKEK